MNSRCSIYAVAFTQHLCNCIHAAPMQPHSRHRTYTAALTPPYCFVALTQSHLCCSSYAVTFMHLLTQHLCSIHTAALMLSRSHCSSLSPLSRHHIGAGALSLSHLYSISHATAFFGCSIPPLPRRSIHAVRAEVRRSFITTTLRDESQVTRVTPQGSHR